MLIETKRLKIRSFEETDSQDLYEYLSDEVVIRYEPYGIYTLEEATEEAKRRTDDPNFLAVALKNGKVIGNLYFSKRDYETYELGYVFKHEVWGKGYATESCTALIKFAFENLNAHKIVASCNPGNENSWRLLERLTFQREETLIQNIHLNSAENDNPIWQDTYRYGLLKVDWQDRNKYDNQEDPEDRNMKSKFSAINKELRTAGRFFKFFNPSFSEKRLRLMYKMSRIRRSKIKSNKISMSVDWVMRDDGSKIRICIFRPLIPKENVPGVLWMHGGGYALGSPEVSKFYAEKLIEVSDCVFIAPEYRLSIEAPYPAALEDNYDVLCWMKKNANKLGINVNQLMVGGDSAGGGLTAAVTLYARDQGEVKIAFQMPLYPMIDDRMTTPFATENDAPVWDSTSNYNAWKLYLGKRFGTSDVPSYAAPARASDYRDLPPTVTYVGDLEPFRDETTRYVENLRNAGVPVEFQVFEGCYHAFDQMVPNAEISRKAIAFLVSSYAFAVDNYFAIQADST